MTLRAFTCLAAVAGIALAGPALAAPPPGIPCLYDALRPEEREIIQYLLMGNRYAGRSPFVALDEPGGIKPYIDAAGELCRTTYGWSRARVRSAQTYTVSALLRDALDSTLQTDGYDTSAIVDYFERVRQPVWSGRMSIDRALAGLPGHLKASGWEIRNELTENLAKNYFILLGTKENAALGFAAGVYRP